MVKRLSSYTEVKVEVKVERLRGTGSGEARACPSFDVIRSQP